MEIIKTYLDNVFAAFPQTENVHALKRDMLAGMEEKYLNLRQNGKNEHEAAGIVIANFGSIDEIKTEIGIDFTDKLQQPVQSTTHNAEQENVIPFTIQEARVYVKHSKLAGYLVGLATVLILVGVYLPIMYSAEYVWITTALSFTGGMIIAAVLVWMSWRFKPFQRANVSLDPIDIMEINDEYTQYKRHMIVYTVVIIAVLISLMFYGLYGSSNIPLMIAVGFAFFRIPAICYTMIAYDYMRGKWRYRYGRWTYIR